MNLFENNTFKDPQGDGLLIYSNCCTGNGASSPQCDCASRGTEGPSNITVYNNTFTHCAQPDFPFSGGQNVHAANNTFTDCPDMFRKSVPSRSRGFDPRGPVMAV